MRTATKSAILFAMFFLFTSGKVSAQPTRLWAYATYQQLSPTTTRLVDLGRFTYSGARGLAIDSTEDFLPFYYLFMNLPTDFSQLNAWYFHRYQPLPPLVVTQFDSFRSWRWEGASASLQPYFTAAKTHTGNKLDSLVVFEGTYPPQSFNYDYDAQDKPVACRVWAFSAADNQWQRLDGIRLARNSASQPAISRRDLFNFSGAYYKTLVNTYYYNAQSQLDSLNTADSVATGVYPTYREHFQHDALGRLITQGGYSYDFGGHYWIYHGRDSFTYDGASTRFLTMHVVTGLPTTNLYHTYAYDASGRIIGYIDDRFAISTSLQRTAGGLISEINETGPSGTFKTYFYYDSLAADSLVAAGVNDVAQTTSTQLKIFPNPADDQIFLPSAPPLSAYKLCAMTGQVVRSGALIGTQKFISVEGLPPGAYILHVQHPDGSRQAARMMKR